MINSIKKYLKINKNTSIEKSQKKSICNCKNESDSDIHQALCISELDAFSDVVYNHDYLLCESYALNVTRFYADVYLCPYKQVLINNTIKYEGKNNNNVDIYINFWEQDYFQKKACLSCGTCLGWYGHKGKMDNTPEEYFVDLINKQILESELIYDKKELAKKICGES